MLKLLSPTYHSILGVDISASAVKILELSRSGNDLYIHGYGRENLPFHAVDGTLIKDLDAIAYAIKKIRSQSRFRTKKVALALPNAVVISKIVFIAEGFNDFDMEELVIIEAEKHIPYPIHEIYIDFEILGLSKTHPGMLDVLIIASKSEHINSRVEVIALSGLTAAVVEVESQSMERSAKRLLTAAGHKAITAIIDIRTRLCQVFIFQEMKVIFSKEEPFGTLQLIEALAQQYNITRVEARDRLEQKNIPADLIQSFKITLLERIERIIQFFYSTSHQCVIDNILLAGDIAGIPDLEVFIQNNTGIVTNIADPVLKMHINKTINPESIKKDASSLLLAFGLSLRAIG